MKYQENCNEISVKWNCVSMERSKDYNFNFSCKVPTSFLPKIWCQLSFWLTFVLRHCLSLHNLYCSFPLFSSCCSQILHLKFFVFFQSLNLLFNMINVHLTKLFLNLLLICELLLMLFLQMLCIHHSQSQDIC